VPSNKFFSTITKETILTSYNFARSSDFVFAEEITHEQYENVKKSNHKIVHSDHRVVYIDNELNLSENDVIFCNTNYVTLLFNSLKKCDLKNLKLITHQTDIPINEKLFTRKPDCISEWYSINVDYLHDNLIPIPLGLGNYYSPKNLFYEKFAKKDLDQSTKVEKVYVNFKVNTNTKLRQKILNSLKMKEFCYIDNHSDDLNYYLDQISKFKFVACPQGNGIDTHRLWETIYAGSIPIATKHISLETTNFLPIIFVENFDKVNLDQLIKDSQILSTFNFEKLKINYWIDQINLKKVQNNDSYTFIQKKFNVLLYVFWYKFKLFLNSNFKKIIYFLSRFKKIFKVEIKKTNII
jgi:hypothetical protein